MGKKAKIKVGDVVRIRFWDHATGTDPMEFYCHGRVSDIDSLSVVLETWAFVDEAQADDPKQRHNQDHTTLIRSTITEIIRYAPERQPGMEALGQGLRQPGATRDEGTQGRLANPACPAAGETRTGTGDR